MILVFDIEGDDLWPKASKVWVLVTQNVETGEVRVFRGNEEVEDARQYLNSARVVVAHNGIWYDRPLLEKVTGRKLTAPLIDTLVWSRLIYSDFKNHPIGGNGIEDWGRYFKMPKGDHTDFSKWSPEMEAYCKQDARITERVYKFLFEYVKKCPQASRTEHRVSEIIFRQWCNGVRLDVSKCRELVTELEGWVLDAMRLCQEVIPPKVLQLKTKTKLIPFNPGSRPQIFKYLIDKYGWVPTELTAKGNPSLTEAVLDSLDFPEIPWILNYLTADKRLAMAQGYLDLVDADGLIHGMVNPLGAITGRMTHSDPNMGQVPKVMKDKTKGILKGREGNWGWEFRDLFGPTRDGWGMVGWDASSLELRMLANRLFPYDRGIYTKLVTEGDVHTHNQHMCGCSTRDQAKTVIYATIYGAGDAKLGKTLGTDQDTAAKIKTKLKTNVIGFADFERAVREEKAANNDYIRGIDGRPLHVRSNHLILNTVLQSDGAVVMKNALIYNDQLDRFRDGSACFMLNVHDEIQAESERDHDQLGKAMADCIKDAANALGIRCPLAGEFKSGRSWAETH